MKKIITSILSTLGFIGCCPAEITSGNPQFVFVRIPEQIQPLDRSAKYEDPLDIVLKNEKVGEVSGGGSLLSAPDADGKRAIEWIGIDVNLSDFEMGMPILKRELLRLGAPSDTVLEYTRDSKKIEELLH
ncbi:MAG: hypothetical protein WC334_04930 [Kiritimatiellales bacterium]